VSRNFRDVRNTESRAAENLFVLVFIVVNKLHVFFVAAVSGWRNLYIILCGAVCNLQTSWAYLWCNACHLMLRCMWPITSTKVLHKLCLIAPQTEVKYQSNAFYW